MAPSSQRTAPISMISSLSASRPVVSVSNATKARGCDSSLASAGAMLCSFFFLGIYQYLNSIRTTMLSIP